MEGFVGSYENSLIPVSTDLMIPPKKKTFYISDTHFFHKGILKHAERPFATIEENDDAIIDNWNSVVSQYDTVYFLGDFCFRGEEERTAAGRLLNSQHIRRLDGKIHLIRGNHDPEWLISNPRWESVNHYLEVDDEGRKVVLFHYPIEDWNFRHKGWGSVHLFGHVHQNPTAEIENRYCVCVEKIGYTPRTLDEILMMKPK